MARNRHKKSRAKAPSPAFQYPSSNLSPAAQIVANRISSGGVEYLMQNLIHIMTDSVKLAEEPEFMVLNLDGEKAVETSQRWLKKYEKRLAAAQRKGADEFHQVSDEMRIEIVAELATPAFRKDVDKRLQGMLDRLIATGDIEKLEMVLLLKSSLGMKSFPWGLCGLILAIYDRTMQQTIQAYEAEKGIYDAVLEALHDDGEEKIDVINLIESPGKLEQIGNKLFAAKPGLRERAEKQIWDMVDAFEEELAEGKITLDLFTEVELLLPFQRLKSEIGEPFTQAQPSEEMGQRVFDTIVQTINEIMTPERFQRLRKDVQSTAKGWLSGRKKWAAAIQGELAWLDGEQYEENKFVLSAFLGQITRFGKKQKPAPKRRSTAHGANKSGAGKLTN